MEKEKKLPNRVDIPIEIPEATIGDKSDWKYPKEVKSVSYTFSAPLTPDFLKYLNFIPETTAAPNWYRNDEKFEAEIANQKYKARQLLDHHYSVGAIVNEFGTSRFPRKHIIMCNKCDEKIVYVVDFFLHIISDHGNSLHHAVNLFDQILDRIQKEHY